VRDPGQEIGRGRCDDDEVGLLAEPDVRDVRDVGEHTGVHRLAGQRLEGGRPDELERGHGGQHPHGVAGLGELAEQLGALVGRDPAGHAQQHPERGHESYSPPSVCWSMPAWISRMAMDSGFSRGPGSTSGPTYSSRPSPSWE
jgi:hypothetical protein